MAHLAGLLSTGGTDYLSRDDEESPAGEAGDQGQGRSEIGLIKQTEIENAPRTFFYKLTGVYRCIICCVIEGRVCVLQEDHVYLGEIKGCNS
jgi:hypothetical protein